MSRRARARSDARPWQQPIDDLGPDFEDEIDIEHAYARELFEHEQVAQQQRQQQ